MRCQTCNSETVVLDNNRSLAYWCRKCHTLELINSRTGKSMGIVSAR